MKKLEWFYEFLDSDDRIEFYTTDLEEFRLYVTRATGLNKRAIEQALSRNNCSSGIQKTIINVEDNEDGDDFTLTDLIMNRHNLRISINRALRYWCYFNTDDQRFINMLYKRYEKNKLFDEMIAIINGYTKRIEEAKNNILLIDAICVEFNVHVEWYKEHCVLEDDELYNELDKLYDEFDKLKAKIAGLERQLYIETRRSSLAIDRRKSKGELVYGKKQS